MTRKKPGLEDRKAREDELPSAVEARALGVASLIVQVQTMIEESGTPEGFDTAKWVDRWLDRPLPALGGRKPMELMGTADGRELVNNIVVRMQSGAYL